ncbi:MFS transporter [Streptomyces sp. NBC_01298]|uniref:MFS transporter n=1 Tax=Streptomyces sp. NBC_01298 TaxID=2903817 RepID=UPI002E127D28|nr:MFS transporter [Streptomyces sp. NBC_01298]
MAFPLIAWMAATLGWRHVFWILGGMGIAWALVWVKVIRNRPEQHPKVGECELVHITEDEATPDSSARARETGAFRRDMGFLLRRRRIWGVFLGQFAIASTLYFFLTWFPTYLTNERGLSLGRGGLTGARLRQPRRHRHPDRHRRRPVLPLPGGQGRTHRGVGRRRPP